MYLNYTQQCLLPVYSERLMWKHVDHCMDKWWMKQLFRCDVKKTLMLWYTAKSFSLFPCLAPVVFVLQLPFERYLGFFAVKITFHTKNWVLLFEIFEIFSLQPNCLSDTVVFHIILERIPHNTYIYMYILIFLN